MCIHKINSYLNAHDYKILIKSTVFRGHTRTGKTFYA